MVDMASMSGVVQEQLHHLNSALGDALQAKTSGPREGAQQAAIHAVSQRGSGADRIRLSEEEQHRLVQERAQKLMQDVFQGPTEDLQTAKKEKEGVEQLSQRSHEGTDALTHSSTSNPQHQQQAQLQDVLQAMRKELHKVKAEKADVDQLLQASGAECTSLAETLKETRAALTHTRKLYHQARVLS